MRSSRLSIIGLLIAVLLGAGVLPLAAQTQLSIATGGTGGVYFPTGGAYAELIRKYVGGYSAVAEVTGASVENVGLVARGDSDIALALADTVHQAYTGTGRFDGSQGPRRLPNLRALGSAYPNAVHIVTLADSGVTSLADLRGKRVSVGAPGSGTEVSAQAILEANGITYDDFDVRRLSFNESSMALRDGQIDVGFWSVGPPTSSILELAETRRIRLIPLSDAEVARAIDANPIFSKIVIPGGSYGRVPADVQAIGTANVIVVAREMDDQLAFDFLDALYGHIDEVIAVHPSARSTTPEFSLTATPIPLHPGAIRYFTQKGLQVPGRLRAR